MKEYSDISICCEVTIYAVHLQICFNKLMSVSYGSSLKNRNAETPQYKKKAAR